MEISVRVGDRVRVRRQRWVVTDIRAHENCSTVTLTGLGPNNVGHHQQVLTPFDFIEPLTTHRSFRIVRPVRWRRECREVLADTGSAGSLRTARTARMDLLPHQLEAALAIVHGHGSRVLIADEVGLGKTVQAALIVAELTSRGAASRVLVLTPAGLREQWIDEFVNRFGLPLTLCDMASMARRRAALPIGVNPWSIEPLVVTSVDYIKRPEVRPAVQSCRWDIVIVDEAHHAAIGSDRYVAVAALCARAPYVVLLTATPHNGDVHAFESLCALGEHADRLLVFRRTRQEVGHTRERHVHQLRIRPTAAERKMHAALDAFVRAVQQEPSGRDASTWLSLSTLRKRALSSAYALKRSVEHRLQTLNAGDHSFLQLPLPLLDRTDEFESGDEPPEWTIPALKDSRREHDLLGRVATASAEAIGQESKLDAVYRLLRRIREPVIIFTEYRDTLRHVRDRVAADATILHGGLPRDERRAALDRFQRGSVLLATDAAGEGLNLHHRCRVVINLEMPWNPMRLEQRIGRVDRIGQSQTVHVFHLIAAGTSEVRVVQRLDDKIARAQADIGVPNPIHNHQALLTASVTSTFDMKADADEEHRRLVLARRLTATPQLKSDSWRMVDRYALVTFSKRRRIRIALQHRGLILLRAVLTSDTGHVLASNLLALRLPPPHATTWRFNQLEQLAAAFQSLSQEHWVASSRALHARFWTTRVLREQSIADLLERPTNAELQPGLFDSRAAHVWEQEGEQRRDALQDARWQSAAATRAQATISGPPEIALVLFTR